MIEVGDRKRLMHQAWRLARAYFAPRDIGSSLNPPRPVEDPKQIAAISFLDENGRREDMVNEAMDMMQDSFGLVRRDVARYMGRLQVSASPKIEDGGEMRLSRSSPHRKVIASARKRRNGFGVVL